MVINGGFDTDASGWSITNVENSFGYLSSGGNPGGCFVLENGIIFIVPTISQEINSLDPGQFYTVSGDYKSLGKNFAANSFGVTMDGIFLFETNSPPDNNWYSFNFEYQATSTSVLLSIAAQLNGTGYPYAVDNIAMYAVPEPSSLCLIGVGGIMGAMFFRNRKNPLT